MNSIIVIIGPDQTGNEKLARGIQKRNPDFLRKAVFATNRPLEKGEIDTDHYYFLSNRTFRKKNNEDEFIFVYVCGINKYKYGLLREEIRKRLIHANVILATNLEGLYNLQSQYGGNRIVSIFIDIAEKEKTIQQLNNDLFRGDKFNLFIKPVLDRTRFKNIQRFLEQRGFVPAKRGSIK